MSVRPGLAVCLLAVPVLLLACEAPSGRFDAGSLSYVNIDSRDKVLCVQAFHTFPDDRAVLKIQSWYRLAAA